jgi:Zn-dependent peptidase ImmA (M78 family)
MTYYYTPLEDFVKKMYHHLSIFVPTDNCMMTIANELNISVHYIDEKSEALCRQGRYRIFIDERLTSPEQWQDFGHELCHVLRHAGTQNKMGKLFLRLQENQAENFMYHFCVPTFMLLNYKIANFLDIDSGTRFIAKKFNVTEKFAKKRLQLFRNQLLQSKSDEELRNRKQPVYNFLKVERTYKMPDHARDIVTRALAKKNNKESVLV